MTEKKLSIREALIAEDTSLEGGGPSSDIFNEDDDYPSTLFLSTYNEHMWRLKKHREAGTFYVHKTYRRFSECSLGFLDNRNKFRFQIVQIITSKSFERFIIVLILVYSILLGMKDYTDHDNVTYINSLIEQIDPYFNMIVYLEFVLKVIAMGFAMDSGSYLDEGWNWIDFFVVVSSALQQVMQLMEVEGGGGKALSALRAFRLLRPLKLVSSIPSLKLLLSTLINSVQSLGGIMGLAIFFFTIFSILGVAIWAGKIHYRCYTTPFPNENGEWELTPDFPFLCSEDFNQCPAGNYCRSRYEVYQPDGTPFLFKDDRLWIDTNYEDFNYGMTQFDDIVSAFITIFICTTMDGWTKIMALHQDIYSPFFVHFYFITVVWICSFFILNLTIASMLMKYASVDKEQEESGMSEPDRFELELQQIGKSIFEVKHFALVDFIVEQDSIQIDDGAKKHLKKEKSFLQKFFQKKHYNLSDPDSPYYQRILVKKSMEIISHQLFDGIIMFVIILNTVVLAMDSYPKYNDGVLLFLSYLNLVFTVIFTAEIVLKMTALGIKEFSKEGFNLFDLGIVITSIIQLVIQSQSSNQHSKGGGIFLIFRTFRVFRIFKLFKIGDMRMLLDSIIFTVSTIGPYVVFLLFFLYIFALIGMSFYAGKLKFNEEGRVDLENGTSPRENFDSLGNTLLTLFIVIMGSGWSDIMIQTIRCAGGLAAVYFILLFIVGGIILLNLFLAIMLGNFDKAKLFGQKKKVLEAFKELMHGQTTGKPYTIIEACDIVLGDLSQHVLDEVLKLKRPQLTLSNVFHLAKGTSLKQLNMFASLRTTPRRAVNMLALDTASQRSFDGKKTNLEETQNPMDLDDIQSEVSDLLFSDDYFSNSSLFIFHIDLKIRRFCLFLAEPRNLVDEIYRKRDQTPDPLLLKKRQILADEDSDDPDVILKRDTIRAVMQRQYNIVNKVFDQVILVLILISSAMLPLDNPLNDPNSPQTKLIAYINIVFTLCFITEASIKIIAKGLLYNNLGEVKPYLDSGWNRVDAFVVSISALDLIMMMSGRDSQFAALKALRALRALRPLRVIKRFENLKLIVNALFATFGAMQNVLMVGTLLLLIFSIMGVSFFKGLFFSCHRLPDGVSEDDIITKEDCTRLGGRWRNSKINFDDSISAMNSLFLMMQGEGWTEAMYRAMDSTEIGMQPKQNTKPYFVAFFVAYMIVGALFISNLFVGVVIDNFNKIKEKNELGSAFVTDNQRQWILMQQIGQRLTMKKKALEPQGFRRYFFILVHHEMFENFITAMVFINTICMAIIHYKMDPWLQHSLKLMNYVFSFVFNMEMFFKLIALHKQYFMSNWNLFDMFIVVSADIGIILDLAGLNKNMSTAVTILRAFRIMRIVKLLQKFDSIRVIIYAVINILPSIANVMSLFILALFIFACVGINLFSGAKPIEFIDQKNNFQTFGNSMLILMRFSTGEGWSDYMYEYANKEDCVDSQSYEEIQANGLQGCGTQLSFLFFLSFQIIATMLILNLAIAAVIDGLQAAQADNDRLFKNDDIDQFLESWAFYDPKGSGKMPIMNLYYFIVDLKPPFSQNEHLKMPILDGMLPDKYMINVAKNYAVKRVDVFKLINNYKLKAIKGSDGTYYVLFADVYKEFVKKAFQFHKVNKFKVSSKKVKDKLKKGWKKKENEATVSGMIMKQFAATTIQRHFRARQQWKKAIKLAKNMEFDEK